MKQFKAKTYIKSIVTGEIDTIKHDTNKLDLTRFQLWVPVNNEWCWFWNEGMTQAHLDRLYTISTEDNINEYIVQNGLLGSYADKSDAVFCFTHCEPFIGTLPTIREEEN